MSSEASVQTQRALYLNALYALDHRDDPSHPLHHRYTGLYAARIQHLIEQDKQQLLGGASDR